MPFENLSQPVVHRLSLRLVSAIAVATVLAACGAEPPDTPPDYSADPPAIATGFHVENRDTIEINVPLDQFLAWRETANLSDVLTPTEGIPGVKQTVSLIGGEWGDVGDRRRVELNDGHYAVETILESNRERFYYQVWGFTSSAGRFGDYATGEFLYEDLGDKTLVTWTYRFRPSSWFARVPLSKFVDNTFAGFMENGLNNMKVQAEAAS